MEQTAYIEVRFRPDDTDGAWITTRLPAGQGSVTLSPVKRGELYAVEARAVGLNGAASEWVAALHTVSTAGILPRDPTSLTASSVADGVHLAWAIDVAQPSGVQYEIQRTGDISGAPDGSSWITLCMVNALAYADAITDGVIRWYRVRAVDFQGDTSQFSNDVNSRGKTVDDGSAVGYLVGGFSYTSTTTSITVSWALSGYLTDRANTPFSQSSSQALASLTLGSTYNLYPYWDQDAAAVNAVLTGGVGSPAWCHVGIDRLWTAQQAQQRRLPLTAAPFPVSTTTSGAGGGSGGGDGGCLRSDMLVREKSLGVIPASDVYPGMELWSRFGFLRVRKAAQRPHDLWIALCFNNGVELVVTSGHPFQDAETDAVVRAHDLTLQTALHCPTGICYPQSIRLEKSSKAEKVAIELDEPHVFYASTDGAAWVETHNIGPQAGSLGTS